jgi:hypothetical protein
MKYEFDDFIGVFEDVVPQEQCDMLIHYFENISKLGLSHNRQNLEGIGKTFKDDETIFHNFTEPYEMVLLNYPHLPKIMEATKYCYSLYCKEYDILSNPSTSTANSPAIRIQKTKPGQGYHMWHYEQSSVANGARILAWTIYLNDVEEGGETEFLYQKRRITPKRGSVVIWPAGFTHTHRGNPPLSGDKFIVTSWIQHIR